MKDKIKNRAPTRTQVESRLYHVTSLNILLIANNNNNNNSNIANHNNNINDIQHNCVYYDEDEKTQHP